MRIEDASVGWKMEIVYVRKLNLLLKLLGVWEERVDVMGFKHSELCSLLYVWGFCECGILEAFSWWW